jgi:hypothetical protein
MLREPMSRIMSSSATLSTATTREGAFAAPESGQPRSSASKKAIGRLPAMFRHCSEFRQHLNKLEFNSSRMTRWAFSAFGWPGRRESNDRSLACAALCVEIDGNAYSVPWRLIGEAVRATIMDGMVRIYHGSQKVAVHPTCAGRPLAVDPAHFQG